MVIFRYNRREDSGICRIGGPGFRSPLRRILPRVMSDVPYYCFESPPFSASFRLLASSSIQGRDENHSSLNLGYTLGDQKFSLKLLQKLLGYNRTVRPGVLMNEDNSRR
ncbi:hypothetical protein AVEN_206906-1 [Araneus ventricosus]|uniref:Uncharacterized protein n=1 Tax=Araneus ventricosus TaxID=182803 RepID=A0A4Y2VMF5_ARAVE|nr:hypothetical protein AVEN_206906-1 [Araneus ventricosus]